MYITLETDYAVRIVDCLARSDRRLSGQAIAESTGVTVRFALNILRKLVKSGIVNSFKGAFGGYEIGRALENINIYDVIIAIDGDFYFSRCLMEEHACVRNNDDNCPYHKIWAKISESIRAELATITFAESIQPDFDVDLSGLTCALSNNCNQ